MIFLILKLSSVCPTSKAGGIAFLRNSVSISANCLLGRLVTITKRQLTLSSLPAASASSTRALLNLSNSKLSGSLDNVFNNVVTCFLVKNS